MTPLRLEECIECNNKLKFYKKYKICVNLKCIKYQVKLRRYDADI